MQVTHTTGTAATSVDKPTIDNANKQTQAHNTAANNQTSTPKRITDQLYARLAENEVSLSQRAKKLSEISQTFFSGVIKAEQIPLLKQRLFEEGFIADKEYAAMGGNPEKVKALKSALDFTRSYSETLKSTNPEGFKGMQTVLLALQNINQPSSSKNRQIKQTAIEFLQAHLQTLKQQGGDKQVQTALAQVLTQLQETNSSTSKPTKNGAIDYYAAIQNTSK